MVVVIWALKSRVLGGLEAAPEPRKIEAPRELESPLLKRLQELSTSMTVGA